MLQWCLEGISKACAMSECLLQLGEFLERGLAWAAVVNGLRTLLGLLELWCSVTRNGYPSFGL